MATRRSRPAPDRMSSRSGNSAGTCCTNVRPRRTGSMAQWTGKSQMTWTLEEPTRQAQILAGETHLTELNKDLTDDLVAKGYKLIRSRTTAQQVQINCGLYFGTEDKATGRYAEHGGTTGNWTPKCRGRILKCGRPSTRPSTVRSC